MMIIHLLETIQHQSVSNDFSFILPQVLLMHLQCALMFVQLLLPLLQLYVAGDLLECRSVRMNMRKCR